MMCLIDVDAVGREAVADLAPMRLLAGQAAGQISSYDPDHHGPRVLAARCPEFGGVDALEAYSRASNDDGVAIDNASGAADGRRSSRRGWIRLSVNHVQKHRA